MILYFFHSLDTLSVDNGDNSASHAQTQFHNSVKFFLPATWNEARGTAMFLCVQITLLKHVSLHQIQCHFQVDLINSPLGRDDEFPIKKEERAASTHFWMLWSPPFLYRTCQAPRDPWLHGSALASLFTPTVASRCLQRSCAAYGFVGIHCSKYLLFCTSLYLLFMVFCFCFPPQSL